jgi:hypothetical protein
MPAKPALQRLNAQIEELIQRITPRPRGATLICPAARSEEQVEQLRERHYASYPESRMAELLIMVLRFAENPEPVMVRTIDPAPVAPDG